jgi:hypothetical protein
VGFADGPTAGSVVYEGNGDRSVFVAEAQFEPNSRFRTSAIRTTADALTRSPDLADIDLTGDWFDPSKGTLVTVCVPQRAADSTSNAIHRTAADRFSWGRVGTAWRMRLAGAAGAGGASSRPVSDANSGYSPGDVAAFLYGIDVSSDIARPCINGHAETYTNDGQGDIDTSFPLLIGRGSAAEQANTYNAMFYIPALLSEAQMEALGADLKAYYGGA